jgi:hypothetical protein
MTKVGKAGRGPTGRARAAIVAACLAITDPADDI